MLLSYICIIGILFSQYFKGPNMRNISNKIIEKWHPHICFFFINILGYERAIYRGLVYTILRKVDVFKKFEKFNRRAIEADVPNSK